MNIYQIHVEFQPDYENNLQKIIVAGQQLTTILEHNNTKEHLST